MRYILILIILPSFLLPNAYANDSSLADKAIEAMSLEELMNVKVTVATLRPSTVRESPGIISIITREEIRAMGARDLIDVLRMVPGFDFGTDGWSPTGPSLRGIWGAEGRILVLWDGIELNELSAGGIHFGNRYPVDQIKSVEIIRGPGSVIHGGFAEVAVISIKSLPPEDLNGWGVGASYGQGTDDYLHRHGHLTYGKVWDSVKFSGGIFTGDGQRTDQDNFVAQDGTQLNHKDNWDLKPLFVNLGLTAGDFEARLVWDKYQLTEGVSYGETTHSPPQSMRFENVAAHLKYNLQVTSDLSLTPYISHQHQYPWWVDKNPFYSVQNRSSDRTRTGVSSSWDISQNWNMVSGLEVMRDASAVARGQGTFYDGNRHIEFMNYSGYTQAQYSGSYTATVGGRYEYHSSYFGFFVPRASLTKTIGEWHFKVQYAEAFRSPTISNIHLGVDPGDIHPEKTQTAEVEVGRKVGSGLLSANIYHTKIRDPLIYLGSSNQYQNQSRTGSAGIEIDYKLRPSWGLLNVSVSYYQLDNDADYYKAEDDYSLAAAPLKATALTKWNLSQKWALGSSLIFLGKRYGYDYIPSEGSAGYRYFDPSWLLNLTAEYTFDDWAVDLSIHDLFDQNPHFLQHYRGQMTSIPGPSREIFAKVRYGF